MKTLQEIVARLKSRKYNRHKVDDLDSLTQAVSYYIEREEPIKIVGYWGVTDKEKVDDRDEATLEFLNEISKRIEEVYDKGIRYTLIISDSHATMNGYSEDEFQEYVKGMKKLIDKYENVDYVMLSELRTHSKLGLCDDVPFTPDEKLYPSLIRGAKKMFKGEYLEGIMKYYKTRKQETKMIEDMFPNHIFFTYNSPDYRELLPNLPILYLRSTKGTSHPPWLSMN